jgi:hypothetical protein
MARKETEMQMITDYEEETRVQETSRVQVRKSGNYAIGQMRSRG